MGWGGVEQEIIQSEVHLPMCWDGRPAEVTRTGRAGPPSWQDPGLGPGMFLFGAEQDTHSGSETHGSD